MMWELASAVAGSLLFFAPVSDNFASKGNAPLGSYDTGQPRYTLSNGTNADLQIINGKLTNTSTSGKTAGYVHVNIGKQVSSIGGTFVLKPGTIGEQGSAAFLIWNDLPLNQITPETGFHIAITRSRWEVLAFTWDSRPPFPSTVPKVTPISVGSGVFATPLPNDGATALSFSADINVAAGTAMLHLPDGTTRTIGPTPYIASSPGIGRYAGWEVYQSDASSDDKAAFISLFAK